LIEMSGVFWALLKIENPLNPAIAFKRERDRETANPPTPLAIQWTLDLDASLAVGFSEGPESSTLHSRSATLAALAVNVRSVR